MKKLRLAILASGSGSNAEAIIKWAQTSELATVACLGCNVKRAAVLSRAENFKVPYFTILKKKNESREDYDARLISALVPYKVDWVILAGFMRLLSRDFLKHFEHKIINIHPSLLPAFPGLDGYGDAFAARVTESGCTVHYVDEGIDSGEIIAQQKFLKVEGETLAEFKKRGLAIENCFYPEVLEELFRGLV